MAFFRVAMLSEMTKMLLFYYANDCVFLFSKTIPISFLAPDYYPTSPQGL